MTKRNLNPIKLLSALIGCLNRMVMLCTIKAENRELRKLVREMYDWTNHKDTKWAKRAKRAIQK